MKKANPFYLTRAWKDCRESILDRDNYLCQHHFKRKRLEPATTVHHIQHLETHPHLALEPGNLISLCAACHNAEHPERGFSVQRKERKKRRARIIRG